MKQMLCLLATTLKTGLAMLTPKEALKSYLE